MKNNTKKDGFMKKVAIVTDSNSGITQSQVKDYEGLYVIPMPFTIGEEEYFEDINLSQEDFYQKLLSNEDISTSQPAIGDIVELWEKLLKKYDQVVHIPMSSALSMSCETAKNFAKQFDGKVQVVDNHAISVTLKESVFDALKLAKKGFDAKQIKEALEDNKKNSSIYIMVSTLKYLKKGGRITPAAAAIGTLLKIKPVLQIQGGKLDQFAKVLNEKVARNKMIEAVKKDFETRFKDFVKKGRMRLYIAHTNCQEKAQAFAEEVRKAIPNVPLTYIDPLSLSVACHIGDGALAVATSRVLEE